MRPKLTPDLLLSDNGIGFVLRYFPKAFKPRGQPGHEVDDLRDLIKLYTDWHSRLIPYYSFKQFVRKVEKVGASNHVRRCISELKDRVDRGGDPTKLHEPPVEEDMPTGEPDGTAPENLILGTEAPLSDIHLSRTTTWIPCKKIYVTISTKKQLMNLKSQLERKSPERSHSLSHPVAAGGEPGREERTMHRDRSTPSRKTTERDNPILFLFFHALHRWCCCFLVQGLLGCPPTWAVGLAWWHDEPCWAVLRLGPWAWPGGMMSPWTGCYTVLGFKRSELGQRSTKRGAEASGRRRSWTRPAPPGTACFSSPPCCSRRSPSCSW